MTGQQEQQQLQQLRDEIAGLRAAQAALAAAADGDSNDAEIEAGQDVSEWADAVVDAINSILRNAKGESGERSRAAAPPSA